MRLSLQTDYTLRTLLFLATRTGRATVSDVAEFFGISAHHVGKVVHQLGRLGYVRNRRGPGGGIELGRSPKRRPLFVEPGGMLERRVVGGSGIDGGGRATWVRRAR